MRRDCLLVLGMLFALTLSAIAAGINACTIKGTVTDEQGKHLVGVTVELSGIGIGTKYSTKTDKQGYYILLGVEPGNYRVDVLKDNQILWTIPAYQVLFASTQIMVVPTEVDTTRTSTLDITIGKTTGASGGPAVPLTPAQQQVLEELQKKAEAAPKKDDKLVKLINQKIQAAQDAQRQGDWGAVVSDLTEVTDMDPMNAGAWATIGLACLKAGKPEQGAQAYTKAVALKPSEAPFHQNLAVAFSKLGQVDDAVTEFNSAAAADPAGAGHYYLYEGMLLNNNARDTQALAAFDKAIAADPKLADAYYYKGVGLMNRAQMVDGKLVPPAGAAEALRQYLALQPAGSHADEAKAQLARIGG